MNEYPLPSTIFYILNCLFSHLSDEDNHHYTATGAANPPTDASKKSSEVTEGSTVNDPNGKVEQELLPQSRQKSNCAEGAEGRNEGIVCGNVSVFNAEEQARAFEEQKRDKSTAVPVSSQSLGDDKVIEKEIAFELAPQLRKNNSAEETEVNVGFPGASLKGKRTLGKKHTWDTSNLPPVAGSTEPMNNLSMDGSETNILSDHAADDLTAKVERKVFIIHDKRMLEHRPKAPDTEHPGRITSIIKKLEESGLLERCEFSQVAPEVQRKHILAVHTDEEYVNALQSLSARGKQPGKFRKFFDHDIVSSKGTSLAVHLAAGAVVEACDRVASSEYESAFAIVRPPGHHAHVARASGFCFLNNIAIAARHLQAEHKLCKILIVDFDVHHRDGTQSIFYDDDTVMFCSIHRGDIYFPSDAKVGKGNRIGQGKGQGFNVNLRLKKALTDQDMLAVFDFLFLPLAREFQPDFVLVSAGFDAAVNDNLGKSFVTPPCFCELVWRLKSILHGKIVLVLEGGYDPESLPESCVESLRALLDGRRSGVLETTYEGVDKKTWKEIGRAYNRLKQFWPVFAENFKPPGAAKDLT